MNFKPFNVHSFHFHGKRRNGFTAVIQPADEDRKVKVYLAVCSKKDRYSRKEGVKVALSKPPVIINARHIDAYLTNVHSECFGWFNEYSYVYKYMV